MTAADSTLAAAAAAETVPSGVLAEYALGLASHDVPSDVRMRAAALILDTIAAGIHGSCTDVGRIVHDEARSRYRRGSVAVWGHRGGLDAAGAAFVNATQSHSFELDDYSPPAKTHPGVVVVPTALAVAAPSTTGAELITSVVAAYDVMVRVSLAINAVAARARGFHMTGLAGPFGSAVAAGRLTGLTVDQLVNAIGTAASTSAGIFAFSAEGAMTKPFHAGRAAEAGIVAARLAARGFHGPSRALDAQDGGLLRAVSPDSDANKLTESLRQRFEIARVAIKPYPCCGSNHSSIDAALELRNEGVEAAGIERIEAHNASGVIMQCGFPYVGGAGALEAQMSLAYCIAVAMLDGGVGLAQFAEGRRNDPRVLDLAARVTCVVDPHIDQIYPREFPGMVRVILRDGRILERYVSSPRGTPQAPMSDDQVLAKFRDVTTGILTTRTSDRIIDLVTHLDSGRPIGELTSVLARVGRESVNGRRTMLAPRVVSTPRRAGSRKRTPE